MIFPLLLLCEQPHNLLWALKSPSSIQGVGSCVIRLSKSWSIMSELGGNYIEQSVIFFLVAI